MVAALIEIAGAVCKLAGSFIPVQYHEKAGASDVVCRCWRGCGSGMHLTPLGVKD